MENKLDVTNASGQSKEGGKWAAEVYDFLRIFGRINGTIYGLLMIEIGWVLLLTLIAKLTPSTSEIPYLTVPWPGQKKITLIDLFLPGALLLGLAWLIWSRSILYGWYIVRALFIRLSLILLEILLITMLIINILLLWLTWPLEIIVARRFIGNWDFIKNRKEIQRLTRAFEQDLAGYRRSQDYRLEVALEIGRRNVDLFYKEDKTVQEKRRLRHAIMRAAIYRHAVEETGINAFIVYVRTVSLIRPALKTLVTKTFIAFAPLQSHTYREDIMASKVPAQLFSTTIDYTRSKLAEMKFLQYIRFEILPEHMRPRNVSEAGFLRKILGFDALIWGSYLEESNKIWFNIDRRLENQPRENGKTKTRDPLDGIDDIFRWPLNINYSKVIVDQNVSTEMYIALLITLIAIIKPRTAPSGNKTFRKQVDQLRLVSSELDLMIEHLVFDFFPRIEKIDKPEGLDMDYRPISQVMAELVSNWIGYVVADTNLWSEWSKQNDLLEKSETFLNYLNMCIQVDPSMVEHYYRAGFFSCLLGKGDEALSYFNQARDKETTRNEKAWAYISAEADGFLQNRSVNKVLFASYLTYKARAINLGTDFVKELSLKKLREPEEAVRLRFLEALDEPEVNDMLRVKEKLLSTEYKSGRGR